MKILSVVGARPNFMKIAPILKAFRCHPEIESKLVHTGQHYDAEMSDAFFRDLQIPAPDINLGIGSGSHAEQTARVMLAFEPVLLQEKPDWVVVVGDVNSTMACTLVAVKLGIKVAHVEAGLRSFDRQMPEEINRLVTDALADLLLTPSPDGDENLLREGAHPSRIRRVGNVMIDTLMMSLEQAKQSSIIDQMELTPGDFAVVTLHRPSNVDVVETLTGILGSLGRLQAELPVIFPVHPRTRAKLAEFGLTSQLAAWPNFRLCDPLGYLDFLRLWSQSRLVLTDSGGLQEETTALGIPCLTLRENTERPITVTEGTNRIVGTNPENIDAAICEVLHGTMFPKRIPELWDGKTAGRIVACLLQG